MGKRNKRTKLKKSMGPGSIWAVAVGSIIGWGCFIQVVSGQNVQVDRFRCFWDFWQAVF